MFISYFTDPILQAPTIGSMLMCFSSALVGVVVFLKKRSLLGEALSHAAYPGVAFSAFFMAVFFPNRYDLASIAILIGAFITAFLGLCLIDYLEKSFKVKNDAALCFVLSFFFGIGVLVASRMQFSHALWFKMVQVFLYGQAATMTFTHVILYFCLCCLLIVVLFFFHRQIGMGIFDRNFALSVGVKMKILDVLVFILLVLAIVVGIRSVGVVLMAGMLILPAIAARQLTHRLHWVFIFSGLIGALSGFLGNYLSVEIPQWGESRGWDWKFSLPTGPMILLSAAAIAFLSLVGSFQNGLLSRCFRVIRFKQKCREENLMKFLWRLEEGAKCSYKEIQRGPLGLKWSLYLSLRKLKRQGWIEKDDLDRISLTLDGRMRASQIVRVHRLWEVYLVFLGQGAEKVHRSAEEMEHIITPELEKMLVDLLGNPLHDPHLQPIPPKGKT